MTLPIGEWASLAWSQLWQVTALALVVGLVTWSCCRRRPHLAYVLWMLVVLKCLTPPLWSSPTGFFSWAQFRIAPVESVVRSHDADVITPAPAPDEEQPIATSPAQPERGEFSVSSPVGVVPVAPAPVMPKPPIAVKSPVASWWDRVSLTEIVAVLWMIGSLGLAGLLRWKWSAYRRVLRHSAVPSDAAIERLAAQLAERLGLRRKVRVVVTTEPIGPAVFGLLRPVVVLPQALILPSPFGRGAGGEGRVAANTREIELRRTSPLTLTLSQRERGLEEERLKQIEPILAHELVHVRRGDTFWGALQLAVEVIWWFHPLVWWANRETCRERERCCDEEVVAGLKCQPAAYARCLLDVLESERNWQPMVAISGGRSRKDTVKRLEDIMNRSSRFCGKTPRWVWAVLLVAATLVLPGSAMVLKQSSPNETTATEKKGIQNQDAPPPTEVPVTVLVVAADGHPVKAAEVLAWNRADEIGYRAVRTDENGRVTIQWETAMLHGVFRLVARNGDDLGWHGSMPGSDVAEEAIKNPIRITLFPRDRSVKGICVDAKGRPLAGVAVCLTGLANTANGGLLTFLPDKRLGSALSDTEGRYSIKVPEFTLYRIVAEHPRFAVVEHSAGPNSTPGRIILGEPAGTIQGHVVDAATGEPIRGARVFAQTLMEHRYGETGMRESVSDESGRYTLGSVAPGPWNVLFRGISGNREMTATAVEGAQVKAGETAAADFRVAPGRRLCGQVIDAEKKTPLKNVEVGYYGTARPRSGAACLMVKTDTEGRFEFHVPPGESYVYVAQDFRGKRRSRMLIVEADKNPAPVLLEGVLTQPPAGVAYTVAIKSDSVCVHQDEEKLGDSAYTVHATIRTSDRKPAARAIVQVCRLDSSGPAPIAMHSLSCPGNEFEIYLGNRLFDDKGRRNLKMEEQFYRQKIGRTYCLLIDVPGYTRPKPVEFTFEKDIKPVVVNLERPVLVPVRGRVLDSDGKPVADANVAVSLSTVGNATEDPWGPEYLTDADGRFELKQVYVGCRFAVHIEKEHYQAAVSQRILAEKSEYIDFGNLTLQGVVPPKAKASDAVKPAAATNAVVKVTLLVVTPDGQPVNGAEILARNRPQAIGEGWYLTYRTDENGRVAIPWDRKWLCHIESIIARRGDDLGWHGYPSRTGSFPSAGFFEELIKRPIKITLFPRAQTVEGKCVDAKGRPLSGVSVHAASLCNKVNGTLPGMSEVVDERFLGSAVSDAQGRYVIKLPELNGCELVAEHPRFAAVNLQLYRYADHLVDNQRPLLKPLQIVFDKPGGTIQGCVINAATGAPIGGAQVVGYAETMEADGTTAEHSRMAISDANGRYTLGSLVPADWGLRVDRIPTKPDWRASEPDRVEVKADEVTEVDFRAYRKQRVTGRVIDATSGAPVAGATAFYTGGGHHLDEWEQKTDANGRFEFREPPGKAQIEVFFQGMEPDEGGPKGAQHCKGKPVTQTLTVEPGEDPAPLLFKVAASDAGASDLRKRVEANLASTKPEDVFERADYYMRTRRYDEAIAAFSELVAVDTKQEGVDGEMMCRGIVYLIKQDFRKAIADLTELIPLLEKHGKENGGEENQNTIYVFRAAAYAGEDATLDKALADLAKAKPSEYPPFNDYVGLWAPLLRVAIAIHQGKAETQDEIKPLLQLLQIAVKDCHCSASEAHAMMACLYDKMGNYREAAKSRDRATLDAAKWAKAYAAMETFDADILAAFRKVLLRLVPEMERR